MTGRRPELCLLECHEWSAGGLTVCQIEGTTQTQATTRGGQLRRHAARTRRRGLATCWWLKHDADPEAGARHTSLYVDGLSPMRHLMSTGTWASSWLLRRDLEATFR